MELFGKIALVTGAGGGIGRKIALWFAAEGADLLLVGLNGDELEAAQREVAALGRSGQVEPADVADHAQVRRAVAAGLAKFGRIDILVNNAAILGATAPVAELSAAAWDREIAVNLTGAFHCCREVLPGMIERREGKIVNIASVAGLRPYPLRAPYAVSKAGLIALTRTLAAEVGRYNIQVNAVAPGPVSGRRMERVIAERAKGTGRTPAEIEREYLRALALGRMVTEDDVARTVLFLASAAGDNITGQIFGVDSGYKLD
jgi:NAD(P)-dependent dehydrogenase (short-subunit alcohol dehydrogenase family)